VLEEAQAGRVRVRVRDARTKAFLPKVQVKVIGSNNGRFLSGETDLRGVFVAEDVQGVVTAVARKDLTQYAFYRGKSYVGQPAVQAAAPEQVPAEGKAEQAQQGQGLDKNLKDLNFMNSTRQLERLQERYNLPAPSGGVQVEQAK
jgi:hypothetical protein